MLALDQFKEVASQYKVLLLDAYGVLKNSKGLVPGIQRTFHWMAHEGIAYYIITNDASRSPLQLAEAFHRMGLEEVEPERIISSGMLAKEFLDLKVSNGIVAYLGTEDSAHYIEHPGLEAVPISMLDDAMLGQVNALVLLDDEGFDWFDGINRAVNLLRRRTIPAIVANADGAYPVSSHDVSIAIGGLSWLIEKIVGKKFIRFGKPDSQIFMFAWELLHQHFPGIRKKDALMIGDTLQTDILGGNKFGLDTMLVLTGNTLPTDAESRISSTGISPTFICESAVV